MYPPRNPSRKRVLSALGKQCESVMTRIQCVHCPLQAVRAGIPMIWVRRAVVDDAMGMVLGIKIVLGVKWCSQGVQNHLSTRRSAVIPVILLMIADYQAFLCA